MAFSLKQPLGGMNARALWASLASVPAQLARTRSTSPRRRTPPKASPAPAPPRASPPVARRLSPPRASPRRLSPPRASPRRLSPPQAYKLGVQSARNRLSSNNWKQKAERVYEAFRNAGLAKYHTKNMWIKNVTRIYANYKGRLAHGRSYGMTGGRHYASQGDPDYIPSNHPKYESLRRLRNNIQI